MLAKRRESVSAARDNFMGIALVAHIEHDPVNCAVVYSMKRDRKLDRTEIRREVAAGLRNIFYQELSDLSAQRIQLIRAELFYIIRGVYSLYNTQNLHLKTYFVLSASSSTSAQRKPVSSNASPIMSFAHALSRSIVFLQPSSPLSAI